MLIERLKSVVKPKVFWPSIIILLSICITLYFLKEKEKTLRIYTQEQLVESAEDLTDKTKELSSKKEIILELEREIEEKEYQVRFTLEKLEKEIAAREQAETQLITALGEKRTLEAKLTELTRISEPIELEKIVVKVNPSLIGKILMVNKEHAFVVANLGRNDDLKIGTILTVYRNGEFIGSVQVEQLRGDICAAAILPDWKSVEFKKDDELKEL